MLVLTGGSTRTPNGPAVSARFRTIQVRSKDLAGALRQRVVCEFIVVMLGGGCPWPQSGDASLFRFSAAWQPRGRSRRAQQSDRMRRIAVLMNNAEDDPEGQARAAALRQGLQALGWTEGRNLRIDWHWTAGDVGRIRGDVTQLAGHPPDIIVVNGRVILSEAVQAIRSIPIVFVLVNDPVGVPLTLSPLERPFFHESSGDFPLGGSGAPEGCLGRLSDR